jgi:hypothetical protein
MFKEEEALQVIANYVTYWSFLSKKVKAGKMTESQAFRAFDEYMVIPTVVISVTKELGLVK